jgi:hypothetical protein
MEEQLNRATEEIERLQYENNQLQEEVSRLTIRREEGSGDIAYRLVCAALAEETKKRFAKTDADTITYTLKRDYTMTVGKYRYSVRVREVDV